MPDANMSDEEAQREFDEIQADIAKEKGQAPEKTPAPEKTEEDDAEPAAEDEESEEEPEEKSKSKTRREPISEDDPEDVDPEDKSKSERKFVPLSKYQDTKKTLEGKNADLQEQVEDLTGQLNLAQTKDKIGDKVKSFAEKTGLPEDAVLELVQLVQGENKLDKSTEQVIKKAELSLKKQEAQEKFDQELADFFAENPDAEAHAKDIRAKAFEKGNLDKSLFEIYHRYVKPDEAPKKKTGESSRTTTRQTATGFDVKKVMAKIEANAAKPFEGLTDAQIDEVFTEMEKSGSRYTV